MDTMRRNLLSLLLLISFCCVAHCTDVSHDGRAMIINGERRILISGSIHYPRSTPEMWPNLIQKGKEGGLDAIETYVFWNGHEPRRRQYNFEGNYDLIKFIKEIQSAGLYAILRIGPYACAEWNYGGLPAWLRKYPGMEFRTNNQQFKDEMATFTKLIVDMVTEQNLLAPQGGPIILLQIENEYGNVMGPYGDAGKEYINWAANFAVSLNASVPWLMCQQHDAPKPMLETCNGFYCHDFTPSNPNTPKIWTENWTGWFKAWDKADPHRPAEDLAYAVARFFQRNGTTQNYYMYHGGTNFGRTSGGPYITTTYDYDAPLDEYGNLRQPKWGHLKDLHAVLKKMEKPLVYGNYSNQDLGSNIEVTKYKLDNTEACFISNTDASTDAIVLLNGHQFSVPAWSVTLLPDCITEAYNTAKVKAQTNVMVKKINNAANKPSSGLRWSWRPEPLDLIMNGNKHPLRSNELLEQITTSLDESDYLWYLTSFYQQHDKQWTLSVNTTGHVLYVFLNGKLIGKQYAPNGGFEFTFEKNVTVSHGRNHLALLSATVGLKNYGARYEQMPAGVAGPVRFTDRTDTMDLSNSTWIYMVGLVGEKRNFQVEEGPFSWRSDMLPINRPFTWYKTTFEAPAGTDPVVIDTYGLGKGQAWVNGNSLGRYWPSFNNTAEGPCQQCDYRGKFSENKPCRTGCGKPAQRWYHIPRSFLKPGNQNILVLFEEAGGSPGLIEFRTVTVGTVCAAVEKDHMLELSCPAGRSISNIDFASYGDVKGTCGSFKKGSCESKEAYNAVTKACLGKESCSVAVTKETFGENNCGDAASFKLAVQASC